MNNGIKRVKHKTIVFILCLVSMVLLITPNGMAAASYDPNKVVAYANSMVGKSYSNGYCLRFVKECFSKTYGFTSSACCAYTYSKSYIDSTSSTNIPVGADVFFKGSGTTCSSCKNKAGHVGIYVGNGYVVHAMNGKIQKTKLSVLNSYRNLTYIGWGWHGNKSFTSAQSSNEPDYMFDYKYYSLRYEDLNKAFGFDEKALRNHWETCGKKEGRSPSIIYDPMYYANHNSDLYKAFGYNYTALYNHFIQYGRYEYRASSTVYNGTYYKNKYSDLRKAGLSSEDLIKHFLNNGMKEGRCANSEFVLENYKNRYSDLRKAFGNDNKSYYYHYMEYGWRESRNCK